MLRWCLFLVFSASLLAPATADVYTKGEIAADRARIQKRIAELHYKLTLPQFLTPKTQGIQHYIIETPDVAPNGDPMGFMAARGRVYLPVAGLKFIEDLTMAYAWRSLQGYSLEPFDRYLAMLRWKPENLWPDGHYLNPLEAFGVPPDAWEHNAELAAMGTSLRNEAWAFLLAHEMAHIYYAHPGNRVAPRISQANESQADEFAMALLGRSKTPLLGATLYFQATVVFYMSGADFKTDGAYNQWQRAAATHPVNADRLEAMSALLRKSPDPKGFDRMLGAYLQMASHILKEPDMQRFVVMRALSDDPLKLKER